MRFVRVKSGDSGQFRKPLSDTTIQEKVLLGNRISLRRTGLFSRKDDDSGLFITALAAIIFSAVFKVILDEFQPRTFGWFQKNS